MFGIFRLKKTQLEEFCSNLTIDDLVSSHTSSVDGESVVVPLAMLLLYQAGSFIRDISNDKKLRKYYQTVNTDLVVLETIYYLHSALSYLFMDEVYDEDEGLSALNSALGAALTFVESKSDITGAYEFSLARGYSPNLKDATERFALILEHNCGGPKPIRKPNMDINNSNLETHLSLKAHTIAFAQVQIPVCNDIVQKIIEREY
ncbi:MAG: hypothetical protein B6D73_14335 [gamma proteobacterium symbiont of Stewartia floridana]|nr:MAG: hypothetical protein B6D73_14335 [gamma proteobacterium symbiont of Stewartia floridana]